MMSPLPHSSVPPAHLGHRVERILCAIDGSRGSAEAVHQALALCPAGGLVRFVAVTDVRGIGANRMASVGEHRAAQALAAAQALSRDRGVVAETELVHDQDVPGALLARAGDGFDLLAIGSHHESLLGGIATGSTATALAHRANGMLLVARAPGTTPFPQRILVAVTPGADEAALTELADELAHGHSGEVDVLRTGDADEVMAAAGQRSVSLVVVGRQSADGPHALGSASERILHGAPCSVLVAPVVANTAHTIRN